MKKKTLFLTLFLFIGFTFQNCICNCPKNTGSFFDIQGLRLIHYKKVSSSSVIELKENEIVSVDKYYGLSIDYLVNYISDYQEKKIKWNFSLISEALACSCIYPGESGSKEEKIESLEIFTLKNFDDHHSAGSKINDILETNIFGEILNLEDFLHQDTSLIQYEDLSLRLTEFPILNDTFQVKIKLVLNTGEVYEDESVPIIFK
ncbi:MAG: hypothetical protein R2769_17080 [Saprospiraceae bacterium]